MVIRYSESVLKSLAGQNKTNEPLFEHTLMSHAWALLRNGESDALYGLYVWTKVVTNRKFGWVKYAAGRSLGKYQRNESILFFFFLFANLFQNKQLVTVIRRLMVTNR